MKRLLRFLKRLFETNRRKCPWCRITDIPVPVYNGDVFLGEKVKLNPFYIYFKCPHCGLVYGTELVTLNLGREVKCYRC